jgi:hypothetical protein
LIREDARMRFFARENDSIRTSNAQRRQAMANCRQSIFDLCELS